MNVLVVDDSRAIKLLVSNYLLNAGFAYEHASNGEEALKIVSTNPSFDLILVDWEMPGMSGIELVEKIKKLGHNFKIMMITSKNTPNSIKQARDSGVTAYLLKPFSESDLIDKITSIS